MMTATLSTTMLVAGALLFMICAVAKAPLDGLGLIAILGVSFVIGLLVGAQFRSNPNALPRKLNKRY